VRALRARAEAERLGGVGLGGTLLAHILALTLALWSARAPNPRPALPAYRVELVAAPRPVPQPPAPAATADQPSPPVSPPLAPQPRPIPRNEVRPAAPAQPAPNRPPAAQPRPAQSAATAAAAPVTNPPSTATGTGGTGTEPATIRTEGVEFPFPGYLRNLVSQVYRRWRAPGGASNLEAEVFFFVHRDGSVSGLQFIRRSGSFAFDLEAQGAVEAAARASSFGELPAGYGADVLPVSFFFSPRAAR
jgi:protein TonB